MGFDRTNLYDMQCRIGPTRQPRHAPRFRELRAELVKLGARHPYALNSAAITALMSCASFAEVGNGLIANLPQSRNLYRITSVMNLVRYTTWTAIPNQDNTDDEVWRELALDRERNGDWLSLHSYANGHLRGFRGITWWTTREGLLTNPVQVAHSMGLVNDWIPSYAIVLRCSSDGIRASTKVTVPDIVDGFVQEVFHPTRDVERPASGLTINLGPDNKLTHGGDEFVAGPLPVEQIQMWPIQITPEMRAARPVWLGSNLWDALYSYYDTL